MPSRRRLPMTAPKERILAAMRGEMVNGVPFVPRLDPWWLANSMGGTPEHVIQRPEDNDVGATSSKTPKCRRIIAGSPVYFGGMAAEMKEVFDKYVGIRRKMEDKVGAAFTTSGDPTGGKETTLFSIIQAMLIYGMIVIGDPLEATGHYGVACVGAPDQKTASDAEKLGRRAAKLPRKLRG